MIPLQKGSLLPLSICECVFQKGKLWKPPWLKGCRYVLVDFVSSSRNFLPGLPIQIQLHTHAHIYKPLFDDSGFCPSLALLTDEATPSPSHRRVHHAVKIRKENEEENDQITHRRRGTVLPRTVPHGTNRSTDCCDDDQYVYMFYHALLLYCRKAEAL